MQARRHANDVPMRAGVRVCVHACACARVSVCGLVYVWYLRTNLVLRRFHRVGVPQVDLEELRVVAYVFTKALYTNPSGTCMREHTWLREVNVTHTLANKHLHLTYWATN